MFHTSSMLSLLKIASSQGALSIDVFNSLLNKRILKKLFKLGYIRGFIALKSSPKIRVFIRYSSNRAAIRNCFLISRPSSRVYLTSKFLNQHRLKKFLEINGFLICSTSAGLLTDIEASLMGLGCEPICFIN